MAAERQCRGAVVAVQVIEGEQAVELSPVVQLFLGEQVSQLAKGLA